MYNVLQECLKFGDSKMRRVSENKFEIINDEIHISKDGWPLIWSNNLQKRLLRGINI